MAVTFIAYLIFFLLFPSTHESSFWLIATVRQNIRMIRNRKMTTRLASWLNRLIAPQTFMTTTSSSMHCEKPSCNGRLQQKEDIEQILIILYAIDSSHHSADITPHRWMNHKKLNKLLLLLITRTAPIGSLLLLGVLLPISLALPQIFCWHPF